MGLNAMFTAAGSMLALKFRLLKQAACGGEHGVQSHDESEMGLAESVVVFEYEWRRGYIGEQQTQRGSFQQHMNQMGLAMGMIGLALGQFLLGPVSDKVGRKPVLVASLLPLAS